MPQNKGTKVTKTVRKLKRVALYHRRTCVFSCASSVYTSTSKLQGHYDYATTLRAPLDPTLGRTIGLHSILLVAIVWKGSSCTKTQSGRILGATVGTVSKSDDLKFESGPDPTSAVVVGYET